MADHDSFPFPFASPPRSGWNGAWYPDPATVERLGGIVPGDRLTLLKRQPDGTDAARYPGTVIGSTASPPWIAVEATWTNPIVTVGGLVFETGDILRELFSPVHPFNVFAVSTADGVHKGCYGNVAFPAFLTDDPDPVLVWHDLYLDVVVLADNVVHLLDDDELDAAPAPFREPALHRAIHAARDECLAFVRAVEALS